MPKLKLPGGGQRGEESPRRALERDVVEETGWHVGVDELE